MRTDYATLASTTKRLKQEREQKRLELARARNGGDPLEALAAKAALIQADKKYQQAVRVAIGGIKRIARRGPDTPNQP